jgi:hypothetical protein
MALSQSVVRLKSLMVHHHSSSFFYQHGHFRVSPIFGQVQIPVLPIEGPVRHAEGHSEAVAA